MTAYYNDNDPYCCRVLRKKIAAGNLPAGDVDERDIRDVRLGDLRGYHQIHLFAGIGGFPLGLRRAGVPDDFGICTGGFPCTDISNAGRRAGIEGEQSGLWSEFARIVRIVRPRYVLIENVAALLGRGAGRVLGDLAALGYDAEWDVIPAWSVGAPHIRERVWILAYPGGQQPQRRGGSGIVACPSRERKGEGSKRKRNGHAAGNRGQTLADPESGGQSIVWSASGQSGHADLGGEDVSDPSQPGGLMQRRDNAGRYETVADTASSVHEALSNSDGERLAGRPERNGAKISRIPAPRWRDLSGPGHEGVSDAQGEAERQLRRERFAAFCERSRDLYWPEAESGICGVVDGSPNRVDRLRALGNSLVPAIAQWWGELILAADQTARQIET